MPTKNKNTNSFLLFVTNIIADKYTDRSLSWRGNEVRTDRLALGCLTLSWNKNNKMAKRAIIANVTTCSVENR